MDRVKGAASSARSSLPSRSDHKHVNKMAGLMGHAKEDPHKHAYDHVARPLAALKDPNAFGPPPKNVNYHGGAALPGSITPDTRGLGAPLSTVEIQAEREQAEAEKRAAAEAERKAALPQGPFRADTTGLTTADLPKPPVRRLDSLDQDSQSPAYISQKPKPSLPPRLPPRQNSVPRQATVSPPPSSNAAVRDSPAQKNYISQGAVSRLGAAGVSVPGFGIGEESGASNPWRDPNVSASPSSPSSAASLRSPNLNELSSRFSKLSSSSPKPESQSQGTSLAQKQAALKTAGSFRNDPSSVTLTDARAAASTANNFRERHGDQVAAGWKSANGLNQKYGITNKVNSYTSDNNISSTNQTPPISAAPSQNSTPLIAKKKPPAPPPKRVALDGNSSEGPPPIPLGSKPK